MVADVEWLHRTLQTVPGNFSKAHAKDIVGRSLEFAKGMMFQREKDLKDIIELKNKYNVRIARLRAQLKLFTLELEGDLDA